MAGGDGERPKSTEARINKWLNFGGAITRTGELITKPVELEEAELIIGLCDRFHCLPKEGGILDQDVDIIRLLKIYAMGNQEEGELHWPTK